ncbi:MAG: S8 family serine peptidase [Gemmatimonadetes bacterium]|nr:S8 family serine peptidase [Gemmatimonadota bacterium]
MNTTPKTRIFPVLALAFLWLGGCARPGGPPAPAGPAPPADGNAQGEGDGETDPEEGAAARPVARRARDPIIPARQALLRGFMPLSSTGITAFLRDNPTFDGRGVLIGILDSGIDLGLPGFASTTTGDTKVLDARDFSGEGRIALERIAVRGDTVVYHGETFLGFGRIATFASPPYYAGLFRELPLGEAPAADVNENGTTTDELVVVVVRGSSGWAVVTDTDGDGRLDDEQLIHDFSVASETFTYSVRTDEPGKGPMTLAANFQEANGLPVLDLFFDNSAHGSHGAGIAAGHDMFDVEGFNGAAPGAQLLALKIANNARGGISVTGSMLRAMNYAADYARQRGLPLILNMSFGVGNEDEGHAAIDSLVNEFALKYPGILFVISVSNEGPGVSTVGFPGSAEHVLSACALIPGAFSGPRPAGLATDSDVIADFSSRGGEVGKPDLCAPGVAFSNVPPWNTGQEVSGGTSMAAPHLAGAAALLQSARVQSGRPARAIDLRQALIASARPARGGTFIDMGTGVPNVAAAHAWLSAGHQAGVYSIRSLPDGGNTSRHDGAYRRGGLASVGDTIQRFEVRSVAGQPAAQFILRSDQRWLRAPDIFELRGGPATVELRYDQRRLRTPGLYVGTVAAIPASDTVAGPAFRLVNTVIIPQSLDQPFVEGRDLGPGRLRRYFFDVPANAGGLTVEMELRYRTQVGSLFLFEPNGQPFRGGSNLEAGGRDGPKVTMVVSAQDLIPGVYEAVVVAPEASALSFDIRAALPRYTIDEIVSEAGPTVTVRKRANAPELIQDAALFQRSDSMPATIDDVRVSARAVGAVRTLRITGQRSQVEWIPIEVPEWARKVVVDVKMSKAQWNSMTDFGVTLFDSVGAQVGHGPLTYAFGRAEFEISRRDRGTTLQLELFPAFAHMEPPPTWNVEATIYLMAGRPVPLVAADSGSTTVSPEVGAPIQIRFAPPDTARRMPAGFVPLIEVEANPAAGASAKRRARTN